MKRIGIIAFLLLTIMFGCKKTEEKTTETKPTEDIIEISTSYGSMYVWLYKSTPLHRNNFLHLADSGLFNGTTFHRIIKDFVIQGGDPLSKNSDTLDDGTGGLAYTIPNEIKPELKHARGVLGAARDNNPTKRSSACQFYICVSTSGTQGLDGNYTVFGYVMKGQEVIDEIVKQPKNLSNRPYNDIKMNVRILKKTLDEIKSEYNYTPVL